MNKSEVSKYLKSMNFVPSKKMGQNFLINDGINKKIIDVCEIDANTNVIEIGPGLGAITKNILNTTDHFVAIELDKRLVEFLTKTYPNLCLFNDDILKFDFDKNINKNWTNIQVIANLPYSISSKIIIRLLRIKSITKINILVQKEMAERLLAKKSSKDYNALTVLVQTFATIRHRLTVPKSEFIPMPNVDSWFITITKTDVAIDFDRYSNFLKQCFHSRRKKMFNNLIVFYSKDLVQEIYNHFCLDINVRAEQLSKEQFVDIFNFMEA